MPKRSAGVLLYRRDGDGLRVLLVHPGGPYWRSRDIGAWQIPKGMIEPDESAEDAARREAAEELGVEIRAPLVPLADVRQAGGKIVVAFAVEQDLDAAAIRSNMFDLEWPPRSGTLKSFPEVDEARWMTIPQARERMLTSQLPLLDALEALGSEP
ncbi:putative NUDIX family NTP pyrophosphohydrolase [Sphingomonas vulcanisoli]|uniref:NUDIX family NTP pyrophosphohydrolase n=1 Tax=Sphingomonas vulcanisoli TaxID=1658060 RepID=A0ABX0TTR7_9SPHN|nr:putative NUDIX family NTP pyrophosphohydrolase [Sphingomonas vulcanisoli]